MKSSKPEVTINRHGYKGSGISIYLVRCNSKEDLCKYYASIPGGRAFPEDKIPVAYSQTRFEPVLPGLIPEASAGVLITCQLMVVAASELNEVSEEDEARLWAHEVGHVAYDLATWGIPDMYIHHRLTSPDILGASEIAARVTEYLIALKNAIDSGSSRVGSGLPFVLPWMRIEEPEVIPAIEGDVKCV